MAYRRPLSEYQVLINDAYNDTELVARVRTAAQHVQQHGYGVVESCLPDPASFLPPLWQAIGTAAPPHSLFAGRTTAPATAAELAAFRASRDWPANRHGIWEDGALAHLDLVHQVRLHPRVVATYAMLYGASAGMVAAPDRLNVQLAPELLPRTGARKADVARWTRDQRPHDPLLGPGFDEATWCHVDQSFSKRGLWCVQGLVTLLAADQPGDASLEVLPDSHRTWHPTRAPVGNDDWYKLTDEDKAAISDWSAFTQVRCGAGALVLWDSRTIHQGGRIRATPQMPRPIDPTRGRFVVYSCLQPAWDGLTPKQVARKKEIFSALRCTSHWPLRSKAFGKPRTYGRDDFPVFQWPAVTEHAPGTASEELYGLTAVQTLHYPVLPGGPLLAFADGRGVKRPRED